MKRLSSIFIICLMQVLAMAASAFTLNVEVTPPGAASLNTSGGTYEEGQKVSLRASSHTGFIFQGWYEGEEKVASGLSFTYTMPARDASLQARFNYDPDAPANPAMPDTCTYYTLTAAASPAGAASLNLCEGRYKAGTSVNLRASGRTGFVFDGWSDATGAMISSSASFNLTMPARDEQLTALYHYDPAAPANPEQMGVVYSTVLESRPAGGGSFNTTSVSIKEGENAHLYAYTHTGFRFLRWEDEKGDVVSDKQDFYYVMPNGGGKLFGIFEYDPAPPANPGKNWWDKELGNVIVDDFSPGGLYSAVNDALAGSGRDAVGMITVSGVMNNNDFSIANNFGSLTLLDLSRVTGVTAIPSYAFDNTSLESVSLPATIEKIGSRAFENCKQLAKLTVYAMTPPALESYVFRGIPEGLVVYVPGAVVTQYQDAEGWKDFTILPITEDVRSLTVNLPADVDPKAYAHMWLELRNKKSGQRMHFVMTDRQAYVFANIIRNTSWEVTLRNERGDIFGRIADVEVNDDDVTVDFASLALPQTMRLTVVTPDGEDVTERVQVSWVDSDGAYLGQSSSIAGLPEGMEIGYRLVLPQDLAMAYLSPSETSCKVTAAANEVKCALVAIPVVNMTGTVKDSASGLPLADALVTASQTYAGKYTKTVTGKTDAKGAFGLKLNEVPTSLTVSSSDYVSRSLVCDSLMTGAADIALAEIALKPISGAVISLDFRYRESALQGETAEEQGWYEDYANISYSIFNKTRNKPVAQFNVQYPVIVLLEEVGDYDQLEITATSLSDRFMPVTNIVTIDETQKGDICFKLTQLGGLQATFVKNTNPAVAAQLYDSKGNLCKNGGYSNSKWSTSGLKDGRYTLITMGENPLYNAISSLSQLSQIGLVEGVDYALSEVEVKSGLISEVKIESVPKLDESKLYYTGSNTSFTVNKPSIVAGNFLTLTGKIDFKSGYASQVSNVSLIVDLPEACDFVENSVMVGNTVSNYIREGRRLTVPMTSVADRVRFCIVPTLGGDYSPSAFARFDLNGETVTQPIGAANYSVKNLSISVPSTVAKTTVPVSGTAAGRSTVEIYDGETLIGQTQSLANGQWTANCELKDPYNLSKHDIYAKVTTKDGHDLRSETVECTYDMNAIRVSKVTMYHWNPEMHTTYTAEFDFLNPHTVPIQWTVYYPAKKFTYTVEFTNNDPERISNVILYVHTADGQFVPVNAVYDEQKELWCADIDMGNSSNGYYPVNCSVDFDFESEKLFDSRELSDASADFSDLTEVCKDTLKTLDSFLIEDNDNDIDDIESDQIKDWANLLESTIDSLLGLTDSSAADNDSYSYYSELSAEELDALIAGISDMDFDAELSSIESASQTMLSFMSDNKEEKLVLEDGTIIYCTTCEGLNPASLIERGFTQISTTGGKGIYLLSNDTKSELVDFDNDLYSVIEYSASQEIVSLDPTTRSLEEGLEKFNEIMAKINALFQPIASAWRNTNEKLLNWAEHYTQEYVKVSFDFGRKKSHYNMKAAKLDRLKAELKGLNSLSLDYQIKLGEIKIQQVEVKKAKKLMNAAGRLKFIARIAQVTAKKLPGLFAKRLPLLKYSEAIYTFLAVARDFQKLYLSIPDPCKDDMARADILRGLCVAAAMEVEGVAAIKLGTTALLDLATFSGVAAAVGSGGTSALVAAATAIANIIINIAIDSAFDRWKRGEIAKITNLRSQLQCIKKCGTPGYPACPKEDGGGNGNGNGGGSSKSNSPNNNVKIDPSGFVYEAVATNRVEGVVATIFYKEMVEDMYGDLHENIVKWDAEEYAQENPLFTDEEGNYRWDVPQGLWQVRFEKEGYETTFSEWLPVPPPQLEINIPIKQNVQPNVKSARAFEDAVELEFDKYMRPETLTSENVMVLVDDKPLAGSVTLLNEEESYEESGESFASKVRFNAAEPFSAKEVTLLVKNRVKSYADVRMQSDYMQAFKVELEVRKIECDSVIDVAYGGSKVIKVSVLPGAAAAGKRLDVTVASALTVSADKESVELDENGCAEILISGELPGVGAIQFSLEGYDLAAFTLVNVKKDYNKVATPTVNIASGSTVDKGTEVYLNCETEGAVIYYTLDGSCPCDDTDARIEYDGKPIIVNEDITIKAMAYAPDMYESEIATYVFYAADSSVGTIELNGDVRLYPVPLRETLNITAGDCSLKRVAFTNMTGATVVIDLDGSSQTSVDVSRLPAGIYMVTVETDRGNVTRKLIKSN